MTLDDAASRHVAETRPQRLGASRRSCLSPTRRHPRVVLCALVTCLSLFGCMQQDRFDAASRRASVDALWSAFERGYVYFELRQQNSTYRKTAHELMTKATTRREYIEALAVVLGSLNDPHVEFTNLDAYWKRTTGKELRAAFQHLVLFGGYYWVGLSQDSIVLVEASPPLPAQWLYQLISVCGIPASPLACQMLMAEPGERVRIVLLRMDGKEHVVDVRVPATATQPSVFRPSATAPTTPSTQSAGEVRTARYDDVGYIAIDSLDSDGINDEFDKALNAMTDTKALILDLRTNHGGTVGGIQDVLSRFVSKAAPSGSFQVRERGLMLGGEFPIWRSLPALVKPGGNTYYKPLVVLIDSATGSAGEILAIALQDLCQATLVGHRSIGAGAGQQEVTLPDGLTVQYSALPFRRLDNRTYQCVGVAPDVEIPLDRAKICREGMKAVQFYYWDQLVKAREIAEAKAKLWQDE